METTSYINSIVKVIATENSVGHGLVNYFNYNISCAVYSGRTTYVTSEFDMLVMYLMPIFISLIKCVITVLQL